GHRATPARARAKWWCRGSRAASRSLEVPGDPSTRPSGSALDQCLGHRRVDVIVAHLVADAVGRPTKGKLRHVAGPEHEAVALVCSAEQDVGPETRLHIFEGEVILRLSRRERMLEAAQH